MHTFDFNVGDNIPRIKLSTKGTIFNKISIELLGNAKYICFGIDKQTKTLAVKGLKFKDNFNCYELEGVELNQNTIVKTSMLRKEIYSLLGIAHYKKAINLIAEYDKKNNMLIVDLKKFTF